jgi:hypothetical protein
MSRMQIYIAQTENMHEENIQVLRQLDPVCTALRSVARAASQLVQTPTAANCLLIRRSLQGALAAVDAFSVQPLKRGTQ